MKNLFLIGLVLFGVNLHAQEPSDTIVTLCSDNKSGTISSFDLTDLVGGITKGLEDAIVNFYLVDPQVGSPSPISPSLTNVSDGEMFYTEVTSSNANSTGYSIVSFDVNALPSITFNPLVSQCESELYTIDLIDSVFVAGNPIGTSVFRGDDADAHALLSGSKISLGDATNSPHTIWYVFEETATGCIDSTSQDIEINEVPSKPVISNDFSFCLGTAGSDIATALQNDVSGITGTDKWYFGNADITGTLSTNLSAATTTATTVQLGVSQESATGCESDTTGFTVTITSLPTASLAIDDIDYCSGDSTEAVVTLTGTSPYRLSYGGTALTVVQGEVVTSSPYSFYVKGEGEVRIDSLQDANGCWATDLGTPINVEYNPALGVQDADSASCHATDFTYQVHLDITNIGGTPGYMVAGVTDNNTPVTFTEQSAGYWTSDAYIPEDETVTIGVTDANGCDTLFLTQNRVCDCPYEARFDTTLGESDKLCVTGGIQQSEITISFEDNGIIGSIYDFQVYNTTTNTAVGTAVTDHDGSDYTFTVTEPGTYSLQNFTGEGFSQPRCTGVSFPFVIGTFDEPAGEISGGGTFCDNGDSSTTITLNPTSGVSPFTVTYQRDGANDVTETFVGGDTTVAVNVAGDYTILSLVDGNSCEALPSALTLTATATGVTPPTATIEDLDGKTPVGEEESVNMVLGSESLTATGNDLGAGYSQEWLLGTPANADLSGVTTNTTATLTNFTGYEPNTPDGSGSTQLIYVTKTTGGECPDAMDTVLIVNRDATQPVLPANDTICIADANGYAVTPITGKSTDLITGVESLSWVYDLSMSSYVDTTGDVLTFNGTTPSGSYELNYEIYNNVAGTTLDATMTVVVDDLSAVSTPVEDDFEVCTSEQAVELPAVGITGVLDWSLSDYAVASFKDSDSLSNPITVEIDNAESVVVTAAVTNGVCPTVTSDPITITHVGEITEPDFVVSGGGY